MSPNSQPDDSLGSSGEAADCVVVEGFHALKHALRFGAEILKVEAVAPGPVVQLAQDLAPDLVGTLEQRVSQVTADELRAVTSLPVTGGVVAIARRPRADLAALLRDAAGPLVLLEQPTHHGNVGAVVRVAAAVDAVGVLTTGPLDPWHPAALRGSAGLHFALPVARIEALPETSHSLLAIDPAGEPIGPDLLPARAIYAFGSERRGLSPALLARADQCVALPMRQGVSSLNLATAVAALLYTLRLRPRA